MPKIIDRLRQEQERKLALLRKKQDEEKILRRQTQELDRKIRTHRLCQRAGILESYLKEPLILDDGDIAELIGFIFSCPDVRKKEEELLAKRREKILRDENAPRNISGDDNSNVMANDMRNVSRDISRSGSAEVKRDYSSQQNLKCLQEEDT